MSEIIYWTLADHPQLILENEAGFLSPSELQKLSALRFPKRRNEWLLGRWTAKSLLQSIPTYRHFVPEEITIQNTSEGAPRIRLPGGMTTQDCLSISHSDRFAFCALTLGPGISIGADMEIIEPRSEAFVEDFFTPAERELIAACPPETRVIVTTLVWSAKESMLKALGVGLHWDTRRVAILNITGLSCTDGGCSEWQNIQVGDDQPETRHWAAWWQRRGDFILTIAGYAPSHPIRSARLVEKRI